MLASGLVRKNVDWVDHTAVNQLMRDNLVVVLIAKFAARRNIIDCVKVGRRADWELSVVSAFTGRIWAGESLIYTAPIYDSLVAQ